MIKVSSTVQMNMGLLQALAQAQITALEQTAEALHTEVIQAQVMPFGAPEVTEKKVYGKQGQFAKNGKEYKGRTVKEITHRGGNLQNDNTFVDTSDSYNGTVSLVSTTPYARRLYFHPEYDFNKTENSNARGKWLEPWISGAHKDFCQKTFTEIYRRLTGL